MRSPGTEGGYPEQYADLARTLAEADGIDGTLEKIVARSIELVPCDWSAVAVTKQLGKRPPGLAAVSDPELMRTVASVAGSAESSPGREAFAGGDFTSCPDLTAENRWPDYAREMVRLTPIRSVLSFGLRLHDTNLGVLTFYSGRVRGFDDAAVRRGRLLADHAAVAIDSATAANAAENLRAALDSSRCIGAAMGVLAERHQITTDQAFDLLRVVSSHGNRKLADVAEEFMRTGALPEA
jgi:GAF domain-containing protein